MGQKRGRRVPIGKRDRTSADMGPSQSIYVYRLILTKKDNYTLVHFRHDHARVDGFAAIIGMMFAGRQGDRLVRDLGVFHLRQEVLDAIEAPLLFVGALHDPPWSLRDMGPLEHGFLRLGVEFPALAGLEIHGT